MDHTYDKLQDRMKEYIDSIKDKVDIYRISELYSTDRENQIKRDSELFRLINNLSKNHWDPATSVPLTYYPIETFDLLLTKKSSRIYNNKTFDTVFEYSIIKFLFWEINPFQHKLLFNILKHFYYKWREIIPGLKVKKVVGSRRARLVQFISLEAVIVPNIDSKYYITQFAKLFNYLVDKNIVQYAVLGDAMIVKLEKENRVCFNIYPVTVNCNHINDLNKLIGFKVFVQKGSMIIDFDWNLIDTLK